EAEHVGDRAAERALAVPVVPRPVVDEEVGDFGIGVTGEHRDPTDEDAEIGLRVPLENVFLRPTGARPAGGSGRREQENEPWMPGVVVEGTLELIQARDRLELPRSAR